jgi:DUF4097 and DUF4098 domain-containing protein YvlB
MLYRVCISVCGLLALVAGLSAAETAEARREGAFWVLTSSGVETVPPRMPLRVLATGAVNASAETQDEVHWRLTVRVRGRSQEQANRLLKEMRVQAGRQGQGMILTARHSEGSVELELKAPRTLPDFDVVTAGGPVELAGFDGDASVRTGGGRVKADRIGGSFSAQTGGGDIVLGRVAGAAACISSGGSIRADFIGGNADFKTAGGEIHLRQVNGVVRASTAGGGVRVEKAETTVFADTAGGPIDIHYTSGKVEARSAGGPIHVGAANGVLCETGGGAIRLHNVSGSLRASTSVGSIFAQLLAGRPTADSLFSTGSGDITIVIPSNLGVTIRARNEAADTVRRIVSEFPGVQVQLRGGAVIAEGEINGGGPVLRISGNNGTIFIKRLN